MPRTKKKAQRGASRMRQRDDDSAQYQRKPVAKDAMDNEKLWKYYAKQRIVPDEEWEEFKEALRRPLPTTFRVAGSRQTAKALNEAIEETYVPMVSAVGEFEGEPVEPPRKLPWYPDGLAWQFNVEKKVLRKSPEFKTFHNFLVFETEVGNISRQEAVSMLPPLFLEVEPHHRVLDMCAAPGSKTTQLLEALHAQDTLTASSFPSGVLVANDSDYKRTQLLIHQTARLPSPSVMVTNLDASIYPSFKIKAEAGAGKAKQENLVYDRILCDVPCSGDGTLRKNVGIWNAWAPMDGNGLHPLQSRILQRAMRMLKKDRSARIVYSTCSMNPVENEAVVCAALKNNKDFELMDVSHLLPALARRPGLTSWTPVVDRAMDMGHATFDDYERAMRKRRQETKLGRTHWPPGDAAALEAMGVGRCLRIYPHLQDTGGFFVAVFRRREGAPVRGGQGAETEKKDEAPEAVPSEPSTSALDGVQAKRKASEELADEGEDQPDAKKTKMETAYDLPAGVKRQASEERDEDEEGPEAKKVKVEDADDAEDAEEVDAAEEAEEAAEEEMDTTPDGQEQAQGQSSVQPKKPVKKRKNDKQSFKENPYTFLSPDDPTLKACMTSLNLTDAFPAANVLVRNPEGEALRSLYLTNDLVKTLVKHNDFERIRLMTAGTKIFAKQDNGRPKDPAAASANGDGAASPSASVSKKEDAQFRVLGEGMPTVLPYIKPETIMHAGLAELKLFLEHYQPMVTEFAEPFKSAVESKDSGSHVCMFHTGELEDGKLTHDLVLPIWKSNVSLSLMIDKRAKSAMSLRLFGKDITTWGRDKEFKQKKKEAELEASAAEKALAGDDMAVEVEGVAEQAADEDAALGELEYPDQAIEVDGEEAGGPAEDDAPVEKSIEEV